jgi:fumarate reductase subunit D
VTAEEDHLRILVVFHYVVGGLAALFSLFPVIHIVMGIMIVLGKFDDPAGSPADDIFGWFFVAIGTVLMLMGLTFAACVAFVGRCLARRQHYMYCLVIAGVECMFVPFGTVLGVFTIIELQKESVRQLFGRT